MSDEELESFLKSSKSVLEASPQKQALEELLPDYVAELARNRYLTIQSLHDSYKEQHPDGYGYTQFKKMIRDYQYAHNFSFHNTYLPGEEMQSKYR